MRCYLLNLLRLHFRPASVLFASFLLGAGFLQLGVPGNPLCPGPITQAPPDQVRPNYRIILCELPLPDGGHTPSGPELCGFQPASTLALFEAYNLL